jgi:hypothetical protein
VDEEEDVQNATGATIAVGERVDGFDHPRSPIAVSFVTFPDGDTAQVPGG